MEEPAKPAGEAGGSIDDSVDDSGIEYSPQQSTDVVSTLNTRRHHGWVVTELISSPKTEPAPFLLVPAFTLRQAVPVDEKPKDQPAKRRDRRVFDERQPSGQVTDLTRDPHRRLGAWLQPVLEEVVSS